MCTMLSRLETSGKRGLTLPVLLTGKFKEAVDCLVINRSCYNILPDNEYISARPSSMSHIRGTEYRCTEKICRRMWSRQTAIHRTPEQQASDNT